MHLERKKTRNFVLLSINFADSFFFLQGNRKTKISITDYWSIFLRKLCSKWVNCIDHLSSNINFIRKVAHRYWADDYALTYNAAAIRDRLPQILYANLRMSNHFLWCAMHFLHIFENIYTTSPTRLTYANVIFLIQIKRWRHNTCLKSETLLMHRSYFQFISINWLKKFTAWSFLGYCNIRNMFGEHTFPIGLAK